MNRFWSPPCSLVAVVLGVSVLLNAQEPPKLRLSQHGIISQQIAGTRVTLEYNRPVARGRELFGALVPWGQIWHPGADDASAITFSTDVKVNGKDLAAGAYTLWTIPQSESWTIIFSKAYPAFHAFYPRGRDALRVETTPRTGSHMETMAFYFPVVEGRHAELVLHWGTMVVPLQLDVP